MACGVAVHQGTEADLVGNPGAGEALGDDADHNAEYRCAAVEELNALQLLHVDLLASAILIPLVVGG